MRCLKHRSEAGTIFLAFASAHHVLKGVDKLPTSTINKRQNFRALIPQFLAFGTNSQIVGSKRSVIREGDGWKIWKLIGTQPPTTDEVD
jgi:hypothetical protein